MTLPLMILAGLATVGGLLGIPLVHGWHALHNWLEPVLHFDLAATLEHSRHMLHAQGEHPASWAHLLIETEHNVWVEIALMLLSLGIAITGIVGAYFCYVKNPDLPGKFIKGQWGYELVKNKYGVDELYDATIVKPTVVGSFFLWKTADQKGIDGGVNAVANVIGWFSVQARVFQSGFVRNYALFMVMGFLVLLILMF